MTAAVRQVVLTRRRFLQHASLAGVASWAGLGLASRAIAAPVLAFRPGLVAPRRLLIVAGREDNLARIAGVERGYRHAREIFAAAGVADRIRLVIGEGGHQFYPKEAWPVIGEMARE
jgi:hypothetical protein